MAILDTTGQRTGMGPSSQGHTPTAFGKSFRPMGAATQDRPTWAGQTVHHAYGDVEQANS